MTDSALLTSVLQLLSEHGVHGIALLAAILLIAGIRSRRGIEIKLGGGNGNGHHTPHHGYVSNKRYEDGMAAIKKQLDDHDSDTRELRDAVKGIRSKLQETAECVARIEGKLDGDR